MALLSKQGIEMNGGCCLKQGQGSEGHALEAHHTPTVGSCDKLTATKLVVVVTVSLKQKKCESYWNVAT